MDALMSQWIHNATMDLPVLKILAHQTQPMLMKMDASTLPITPCARTMWIAHPISVLQPMKMQEMTDVYSPNVILNATMDSHAPLMRVDQKDAPTNSTIQHVTMELHALKIHVLQAMKTQTQMDV